jgi:intracellular multiplication protein IcmB
LIKSYKKDGIKAMAMYRLSVLTWTESKEACLRKANTLKEKISSWGTAQVIRTEKANPVQSMLEVLPSIAKPSIHRAIPCLVEEAIVQMPFDRTSSPWDSGTINCISANERTIYPINVGEKQQDFPRSVYLGKTGYGKTFLKNSMLMNALFRKDYHKLPLLAMCTIGYDGELFADTIRSALPEDQHHLIIHDKPKLTADYAVNIFDTDYGARLPKESHVENIVGFLEQCLAEKGEARLQQDFAATLREVVIFSFQYYSDAVSTAKTYSMGANLEVDDYFAKHQVEVSEMRSWTWWDAFDYFHDLGNTRLAYMCQTQAMPTISNLIHVMSENQSIFDDARDAQIESMSIADVFKRRIVSLERTYKNLCVATRYSIESARIIIFDLESVCPKGSKKNQPETQNDRTAALMYQLYFMFQTRKFLIPQNHDDFLSDTNVPKKYHQYHFDIIDSEKGIPKIFDVDEKHRASKAYNFNTELERIIREMRKYGAEFSGASQNVVDWDAELLSQVGAVFIMQINTSAEHEKSNFQELLGFSDAEFELAKNHLKGLDTRVLTF